MNNNSSSKHLESNNLEVVNPEYFDSGYPLDIFCIKESVEPLSCTICLGIYRNPATITNCGHTFCALCLCNLIRNSGISLPRCPQCRSLISDVIESFAVKNTIQNQHVRCPQNILKNLPCEWQDKLELVETHLRYDCKELQHPTQQGYPRELPVKQVKINKVERFICKQCKGIFKDPVLVKCGHTFCRNCLIKYEENNLAGKDTVKNTKSCPECHKEYAGYVLNLKMKNVILKEKVTFNYKKKQSHPHYDLRILKLLLQNQREKTEKERGAHRELATIPLRQSSQNNHNNNRREDNNILSDHRSERESQNLLQEQGLSPQWQALRHKSVSTFRYLIVLIAECLLIFIFGAGMNQTLGLTIFCINVPTTSMRILIIGVLLPTCILYLIDKLKTPVQDQFGEDASYPSLFYAKGSNLLVIKYLCYMMFLSTIDNREEEQRHLNPWYLFCWGIPKFGVLVIALVCSIVIDESNIDPSLIHCKSQVGLLIGVNLISDVVVFMGGLCFIRVRGQLENRG